MRLFQGAAAGPNMVFFGAGESLTQLSQLATQVVESGGVPKDINLGGSYEKDVLIGTLKHLLMYWCEKAPARGSERARPPPASPSCGTD